jgi:hypothetical protein
MSGKDSCRDGKWKKGSIFTFNKLDENGALGILGFALSQAKNVPPTLFLDTNISHPTMKTGIIRRIHYRINPTNAETYILRLWRSAPANPYELNLALLWESPALQADDTDYDRKGGAATIPLTLCWPGEFRYSLEWTGAPGVTPGFIDVTGEKID